VALELDRLKSFYQCASSNSNDHLVIFSLSFVVLFAVVEALEFVGQAALLVKQASYSLPSPSHLFLLLKPQSCRFVFLR